MPAGLTAKIYEGEETSLGKYHDIYFKRYDCDVCEFLRRLAESVYENLSPRDAFFKFNERNVREISLSQAVGLTSPSLTYPRLNLSTR